jgi:ribosomal protein L11 methyltransferase
VTEPRYPYVSVGAAAEEADAVAGLLWEFGASGVEERDATTLNPREAGEAITLVASFADEGDARAAVEALAPRTARIEYVVGDAWRDGWKAFFRPLRFGRLVIETTWARADRRTGDAAVTLDPGHAFGTGQHETTRLLLEQVERHVRPDMRVLDVGCGSGILAIAALRLGASDARAIDVDADAVRTAAENAEANGVGGRLAADTTPLERVTGAFDLVVANIEAGVLTTMAPALVARVAPGGLLMLSGILVEHEDRVRDAYAALSVVSAPRDGEWVALVYRRPA